MRRVGTDDIMILQYLDRYVDATMQMEMGMEMGIVRIIMFPKWPPLLFAKPFGFLFLHALKHGL